jgi:hypothetical protein
MSTSMSPPEPAAIGTSITQDKNGGSPVGVGDKLRILRRPLAIFVLMLVLSLPLRLSNLSGPLIGYHEFRQTQTALSVWEIREHGFSLLHPKLPLFGPPWECPFEYPVFQIAAAAVDSIAPWNNLDTSIRITALIFYYLTAATLFLLAKRIFKDLKAALFIGGVFLFSPYNLLWSQASMIEYAATFFALAYLLAFIKWSERPNWKIFQLCLALGILGCLTKITTFVIPFAVTVVLGAVRAGALFHESAPVDSPDMLRPTKTRLPIYREKLAQVLLLGVLLVLPASVGKFYINYGDKIKERSPYTAWLSSRHNYIKNWNYGPAHERLDLHKWNVVLHRIGGTVLPTLAVGMLLGFCALPFTVRGFENYWGGNAFFGISLGLAPFVAILLIFNLYWVHTYYFIAGAPFFALWTGLGLCLIYTFLKKPIMRALFVLLLCGLWLDESLPILSQLGGHSGTDARVKWLQENSRLIGKDEPVIVLSYNEWSPFAPYYLKRRAFMGMFFDKPVNVKPLIETDYFKRNGFEWLLLEGANSSITGMAEDILKMWKAPQLVTSNDNPSYRLYRLSD